MNAATAVAVMVPLGALLAALRLARSSPRLLSMALVALLWGIASTWIVEPPEEWWLKSHTTFNLVVVGAPLMEELVKAFALPILIARRGPRWFVDGSMIGLSAGTGFAIRENLVYLSNSTSDALSLAIARVTSTNLMHAGCTALVAAMIATPILTRWTHIWWALPTTLSAAIGLHMGFNRLTFDSTAAITTTVIGFAVFGSAVGTIVLGGSLSSRWAQRELMKLGIAAGEREFVGRPRAVDEVLEEMTTRFGADVSRAGAQYVAVQRQLGIIAQPGRTPKPGELERLEKAANESRRQIGVFPMLWLRSRLPVDEDALGIWASLKIDSPQDLPRPQGLWASLEGDRDRSG